MADELTTRRQILRASGLAMSLPVMASLKELPFVQSLAAAEPDAHRSDAARESRGRFCCIFFPNGVSLPPEDHPAHRDWHWFPHQVGAGYQLTRTLESLDDHRDRLTILSGLSHPSMRSSIAHITADSFLTGADSSKEYTNSISLDQLIANRIGHLTRFPSLTLSSDGGVGTPGRTQTLSFTASGRPIPSLSKPRAIFNRLFGIAGVSRTEQRRRFGRDRSVLDNVIEETNAIKRQLHPGDADRLDEYTTAVREIEKRLENADRWLDAQRPTVNESDFDLDTSPKGDAEDYIRSILDLIYVALLTDSTRSITYQITSEDAKGIGDNFPKSLGLAGHHALSHGIGKEGGYEDWARYDRFLAEQLAYFVDRLRRTEDPVREGSLLDNTVVMYGCSTSRTHRAVNYPIVLAGGESMGYRHGQHVRVDETRYRMSDLYVTMLRRLGLEVDSFADSTGSLDDVLV